MSERTIALRSAAPDDVPAMVALLEAAHLPAMELEHYLDNFVVAEAIGRVVGCGGLETYAGCDAGLVRSMVVEVALRGTGVGARILEWVLERAHTLGLTQLFLFTMDAGPFYARFGFRDATLDEFPPAARASAQYQAVRRYGEEWGVSAMTLRLDE